MARTTKTNSGVNNSAKELEVVKHPGGRPTKYLPEFCEQLIECMSRGLSFEAFAGKIGVHKDTLYEWFKKHPEFSDAKKIGESLSLLYWEELGIKLITGEIDGNPTPWIFNMRNRFGWSDQRPEPEGSEVRMLIINNLDGSQQIIGQRSKLKEYAKERDVNYEDDSEEEK